VNKSELVNARLGPLAVQRSCKVGDRGGGRVGKCISDCGGEDKLESLIFIIVLMMLMNIAVILMIILTVRDKKSGWKTLTIAPWH